MTEFIETQSTERWRLKGTFVMATDASTIAFLLDQMTLSGVTARKMFGEFGIFADGKCVGLVCKNELFIKATASGRQLMAGAEERPPYPGAKPALVVDEALWVDREWLAELIELTAQALPAPRKKAKAAETP